MTRRFAALALGLVFALSAAIPPEARAQERVYDAANHRENILTAIQTYLALLQRVIQIANQLQNLLALEEPEFRQIHTLLLELADILRDAQGLVYSLESLDPRFRELFPGVEAVDDLPGSYAESVRVTLDTLRGVLLSTRRNAQDLAEAQWTVGTLREQLLETEGNLEAVHAQGILIGFLAEEVSKATQQLAVLTNLQAVASAHQVQTQAEGIATFERSLLDGHRPAPAYGAGTMHPLVPGSLPF